MSFAGIRGHARALEVLEAALERDRLAHAYIFSGPEGVGKGRVAQKLAQAVVCPVRPGGGCEGCVSCRRVKAGTHPDVMAVSVADEKKEIGIAQVRELRRRLGLRALEGGKKVAVIDDAHLLSGPAQGALLKVLEEPPGDAVLVLLAANVSVLSRPLRSRCQVVRFGPLPVLLVAEILERDHGVEQRTARTLAALSKGSVGAALALNGRVFTEERPRLLAELAGISAARFPDLSQLAERLGGEEDGVRARLEVVLSWYRDLLRYQLLGAQGVEQNVDCHALLTRSAAEGGGGVEASL